MGITPAKSDIRTAMMAARKALDPSAQDALGRSAAARLLDLEPYKNASVVMIYMAFKNEVPTEAIFDNLCSAGKTIVLPYVNSDFQIEPYIVESYEYLLTSPMGIREPDHRRCVPAPISAIELVIVPGLAFDLRGNRIGYGKGCYDRFLPLLDQKAPKIGLAYDFQLCGDLPSDPGDIKMDHILTPGACFSCGV